MMRYLLRLRAWVKPEIRNWLDGFGLFFAITLFFCLIQAAHNGVVHRNRDFDSQRWWYPIYRTFHPDPNSNLAPSFSNYATALSPPVQASGPASQLPDGAPQKIRLDTQ